MLRPRAVNESGFKIRREEKALEPLFRVLGDKPVRWVKQTDFTNEEAIGYLADRLAKLGVETELFKQGAKPGDTVVIGEDDGVVFDWEPTMMAGAELLASPRGTDIRFADIGDRPTRAPEARRAAGTQGRQGRCPGRTRSRAQGRHLDRVRQRPPRGAAPQGEWPGRRR